MSRPRIEPVTSSSPKRTLYRAAGADTSLVCTWRYCTCKWPCKVLTEWSDLKLFLIFGGCPEKVVNITYFGKTFSKRWCISPLRTKWSENGDPLEIKHPHFENRRLLIESVQNDTEHATSRTRLALRQATLCFHFNVRQHSPKGPENVKVKYPRFENSRLGLIESFHERYWKMRQYSCPLSLP